MAIIRSCRVEETPDAFRHLAWQVFFASRGRGVSLDAHFPWLRGGGYDDRSWLLEADKQPAAMLCTRRGTNSGVNFYAVGLVCTAPAFERRGFATCLLQAALEEIGSDVPVLLWTSQHAFYERFGFTLADPSVVATCTFPTSARTAAAIWQRNDWCAEDRYSSCFGGQRGLPTFVTELERWQSVWDPAASLVLRGGAMPIVLELAASEESVPALLSEIGVPLLMLNLPRPVPLIDRLRAAGVAIDARSTAIAMWRPGLIDCGALKSLDISLLDRF